MSEEYFCQSLFFFCLLFVHIMLLLGISNYYTTIFLFINNNNYYYYYINFVLLFVFFCWWLMLIYYYLLLYFILYNRYILNEKDQQCQHPYHQILHSPPIIVVSERRSFFAQFPISSTKSTRDNISFFLPYLVLLVDLGVCIILWT